MAKKPIRVYRGNDAPAPAVAPAPEPASQVRPPTATIKRVQVYKDGPRDRLTITQQVVDSGAGGVAKKDRYQELLESIYDAVLITDGEGLIREVNHRAEHYFLWTRQELPGMNILDLISGADGQLISVILNNVKNGKFTVLEAVCICGDDSRFHAEIVANQLDSQHLCFYVRNVTQRKEMEEQLRQAADRLIDAEKMQSRLDTLSTLFYELNNPLQILTCMAELDKNEEYRKQLDRIVEVLDHLRKQEPLEAVVDEEGGTRYEVPSPAKDLEPCDRQRLLVVDDEGMLREMFVTALKTSFPGMKVESAADGKQALDLFSVGRHGLVIMDVSMPVMNGEEAFQKIRALAESKGWEIPAIIFCTGFVVGDGLQAVVNESPSRACLQKPLSINDLIQAVKRVQGE